MAGDARHYAAQPLSYDGSSTATLYRRANAYLLAGRIKDAAAEFQRIVNLRY